MSLKRAAGAGQHPTTSACCAPLPHAHGDPEDDDGPARRRLGRRSVLRAATTAAAALGVGALGAAPASATGFTADRSGPGSRSGASVVLLGTSAGPPPVLERKGISSAVVVDGAVYLVDAGRESVGQYQRAGLRYADLAGIFLTHLHADHVGGLYDYALFAGYPASPGTSDVVPAGVPVIGPGPADALPPIPNGADLPVVVPEAPTPGLVATGTALAAAYAYSTNAFRRATGGLLRDVTTLLDPHEIAVPDVGASPLGDVAPPMAPFTVFEDDRVRVSAVLVPHGTVFPSFAYRFDTDHGSVTFSGDTRRSENVVALARGSDLLVHEAISLPATGIPAPFAAYQRSIHTIVDEVGGVAQEAEVKNLVLSHLIDFADPTHLDPASWRRRAQAGYGGRVVVGADLMTFRRR